MSAMGSDPGVLYTGELGVRHQVSNTMEKRAA